MIGIISDSHGRLCTIRDALSIINNMGCRTIFHLGDVCDSTHPETANACIQILLDNGVRVIKGNQDKAIISNHIDQQKSPVSQRVLQVIQNLDQTIYQYDAIFTHSLPILQEMGSASTIGFKCKREIRRFLKFLSFEPFEHVLKRSIDKRRILHICKQFPEKILFRGHHHSTKITWPVGLQIKERLIIPGVKLNLSGKIPCVVSCSPLTQKKFMVWDPYENEIECFSFR